jgi:hypothetical protein
MSFKPVKFNITYTCGVCGKNFKNKQTYKGYLSEFNCVMCEKTLCKKCNKGVDLTRICEHCLTEANSPELNKTLRKSRIIDPIAYKFVCITFVAIILFIAGLFGKDVSTGEPVLLVPALLICIPIFIIQVVLLKVTWNIDKKQRALMSKIKESKS